MEEPELGDHRRRMVQRLVASVATMSSYGQMAALAEASARDPEHRLRSAQEWVVDIMRQVVVFDAADLTAESAFWAAMLGGRSSPTIVFTASSTPTATGA
jgi:hypothetical protein